MRRDWRLAVYDRNIATLRRNWPVTEAPASTRDTLLGCWIALRWERQCETARGPRAVWRCGHGRKPILNQMRIMRLMQQWDSRRETAKHPPDRGLGG